MTSSPPNRTNNDDDGRSHPTNSDEPNSTEPFPPPPKGRPSDGRSARGTPGDITPRGRWRRRTRRRPEERGGWTTTMTMTTTTTTVGQEREWKRMNAGWRRDDERREWRRRRKGKVTWDGLVRLSRTGRGGMKWRSITWGRITRCRSMMSRSTRACMSRGWMMQ
ncbi:hypothetical protein ACHAXS_000541 [Conticribra weissflogii]